MTVFRTFLIFFFSSYSLTAFAAPPSGGGSNKNWYIDLSLAPVMRDQNDSIRGDQGGGSAPGESASTSKTVGYDVRTTTGYAFNSVWLVGLTYNMFSTSTTRSAGAPPSGDNSKDSTTSISEFGPAVGALFKGWHATFTYVLSSEFKYKDKQSDSTGATVADVTSTLKDGSGFIFNFGYSFNLTNWLDIGPSLIYRKVSYKTVSRVNLSNPGDSYSGSLADKAVQGSLSPFLSLTARF